MMSRWNWIRRETVFHFSLNLTNSLCAEHLTDSNYISSSARRMCARQDPEGGFSLHWLHRPLLSTGKLIQSHYCTGIRQRDLWQIGKIWGWDCQRSLCKLPLPPLILTAGSSEINHIFQRRYLVHQTRLHILQNYTVQALRVFQFLDPRLVKASTGMTSNNSITLWFSCHNTPWWRCCFSITSVKTVT